MSLENILSRDCSSLSRDDLESSSMRRRRPCCGCPGRSRVKAGAGGLGRGAEGGGRAGGAAARLGGRGAAAGGSEDARLGLGAPRSSAAAAARTRWQEARALPAAVPAAACRGRRCIPGKPRPRRPAALDVGRGAQRPRRGGRGRRGAPGGRCSPSVTGAVCGFCRDTLTLCLRTSRTGQVWKGR